MYLTGLMSRQIQHKVREANDEQNKQILVIDPDRIRYMSTQTVLLGRRSARQDKEVR